MNIDRFGAAFYVVYFLVLAVYNTFLTVAPNPHTSGVVEIVLVNCMQLAHFLYGQPFTKPKVTL